MQTRVLSRLLIFTATLAVCSVWAWAQNSSQAPAQSWKESSTHQSTSGNINPTRTRESHTESNGRTVDKQTVERLGPDGRYEPYLEVEKESVKVDATTMRTVERTYVRGPDGERTLQQVTQEETRRIGDSEQKTVRSISNPDANGTMQVVRRQISDSKQLGPNLRETKTTVMSPNLDGVLAPAAEIQERETKTGEHSATFKKSTLLPDGNGGWQVSEVREGTVQGDPAQGQTKDEKILRPDGNGNLAVVQRTVTKQTATAPGEKRKTVDQYATDIPGTSPDGSLRLAQRTTTVERISGTGTQTVTQTEQANPANPSDGMRVTGKTIDIVRPGFDGSAEQKTTTLSLDSKGDLGTVWIDTGKKNSQPAIQVDTKTAPPK
jgi:hypothetical protein